MIPSLHMLFLENVLQSLVHTPPSHLLNIKTASTPVEPQTCLEQQNFQWRKDGINNIRALCSTHGNQHIMSIEQT